MSTVGQNPTVSVKPLFFFVAIKYATIHLVEKVHNAGNDNKVYIVYLYI